MAALSVRPSTLIGPNAPAGDGVSTSGRSGYPEHVLLNKTARISGDRNATTASCRTMQGQPVAVTFWLADPPDVSRFSVHLPGVDEESLSDTPYIISAEGAFVLLCVTLDGSDLHFVYSSRGNPTGGKKKINRPSLHLLPDPKPAVEAFECQQFGILPLGGGDGQHYAVAFLDHKWNFRGNDWTYRALVFSSVTRTWRRSKQALLRMSESDRPLFDRHATSKQIAVAGAGSLGWVDFLRGIILVSNLFDERPVITYIPLPAEKACITDRHGYPLQAPEYFRDVVGCDGDLIRFVDIEFQDPGCRTNGKAWKATTWNWNVSSKDDDWCKHRTVDVAQISVEDPSYSALLFPHLLESDDGKKHELELKSLCFLNPTLSVCDDDLLYMLAEVDEGDDTALVLAVDMKHAALQALVQVSTQNSYTVTMYCSCAFPKYYIDNVISDTGDAVDKDKSDKLQQGRPNSNDPGMNLQKKRRKKKQARIVDRRVEQPFLLYFIGCVLVAIIVKVFCHLSSM